MAHKTIFITGGASGIGRAVAAKFGGQGWFVGLADVNESGMKETAAMIPAGMSSLHKLDVIDKVCGDPPPVMKIVLRVMIKVSPRNP